MRYRKKIIIWILILVAIKIVMLSVILAPSSFADGYLYSKMARSFFNNQDFTVHNQIAIAFPPLYSILISPAYLFSNMQVVYFFMKVINAILSSLIVIPAWLLGKQFLRRREAFLFTILVSILPFSFSMTNYIMSENLFYPLILFFIYFFYKSFISAGYKYDILAGITLGLLLITRLISVFLLPMIALIILISIFKKSIDQIKKKAIFFSSFLVLILIFLKPLISLLISKRNPVTGASEAANLLFLKEGSIISGLSWLILYPGYLILASGVIFFMLAIYNIFMNKEKDFFYFKWISVFSFFFVILLAVNHNISLYQYQETLLPLLLGRPLGRYVIGILPLLILNGFMGARLLEGRKIPWKIALPTSLVLLVSSVMISFQLFPFNNLSLTYIGAIKYIFEYFVYSKSTIDAMYHFGTVLFFGALFFVTPILLTRFKVNLKKLFYFFLVLFSVMNLGILGISHINSQVWYDSDQMQIGLWVNENDGNRVSKILFDQDYVGKATKNDQEDYLGDGYTIAGFWMNDEIGFDDISNIDNYDYAITKKELENPKLLQEGNWILYSSN